jgi:ACS family glucarate transporter-like MFS transporter
MNTGANLGGALSPILTPALAQRIGWDNALHFAALIALVGAFFWLGVHPQRSLEISTP